MKVLKTLLEKNGITSYAAEEYVNLGEQLSKKIQTAIRSSDMLIAIITKDKFSTAVNQEIGFAISAGIPVIPLVEEGATVGFMLEDIEQMRFNRNNTEHACEEIVRYINTSDSGKKIYPKNITMYVNENNKNPTTPLILFISYSVRDEVNIQQLASELRKQEIPVYAYPFDLEGSAQIHDGISAEGAKKSLAVALSQSSITSTWVNSQIKQDVLDHFENDLNEIYLLKIGDISDHIIRSLKYPKNCKIVDLSGGNFSKAVSFLFDELSQTNYKKNQLTSNKSHHYKMVGIFEPARPATELFSQLDAQIKNGSIDQKYLYWDVRSAVRWEKIAETSGYMTAQTSTNLLAIRSHDIIQTIINDSKSKRFSFINLGVGTGVKDHQILSNLLLRDCEVSYFAVDESFPMIQLTINHLRELISAKPDFLRIYYIVDDMMNLGNYTQFIKEGEEKESTRIIALLGSAIGNFRESKILEIVKDLMTENDYLILGTEYIADRENDELIRNYSDKSTKEFMSGPIRDMTGSEIPESSFDFSVLFEKSEYTDVAGSKTIVGSVTHNNKPIQLFSSNKYDKKSLEQYLEDEMGFKILKSYVTSEIIPRYGKYILKLSR